jgi:hypothetical protein
MFNCTFFLRVTISNCSGGARTAMGRRHKHMLPSGAFSVCLHLLLFTSVCDSFVCIASHYYSSIDRSGVRTFESSTSWAKPRYFLAEHAGQRLTVDPVADQDCGTRRSGHDPIRSVTSKFGVSVFLPYCPRDLT